MNRLLKGLGVLTLAGILLLIGAWATSERWLPFAARWLVAEDPLARADLIVVLSGSIPDRPRHAAELYVKGYAPRLMCASSQVPQLLRAVGMPLTQAEVSARVLRANGVPADAILVVNRTTSTFEELTLVRDTLKRSGWRRVILVSSPTHLRRMRLTWDRLTEGGEPRAILRATPYSPLHLDGWWRSERELISVQNEYAKIAYYLLFTLRGRTPIPSE